MQYSSFTTCLTEEYSITSHLVASKQIFTLTKESEQQDDEETPQNRYHTRITHRGRGPYDQRDAEKSREELPAASKRSGKAEEEIGGPK